jgi:hypothetical protein
MKRIVPRLLIVAVVVLQLIWIVAPRGGSSSPSPRFLQAMEAHASSPKSKRDAAIAEAKAQDDAEARRWVFAPFAMVIGIDIALIYFFWNFGTRKTTASYEGT